MNIALVNYSTGFIMALPIARQENYFSVQSYITTFLSEMPLKCQTQITHIPLTRENKLFFYFK